MRRLNLRTAPKPGDVAPRIELEAATREGRVSTDDYRGERPLLIGVFRGLHCPFCRRHLAAQAAIERALREKGVECLAIVSGLFFRYRPMPDLLVAADPERASHRALACSTSKPYRRAPAELIEAALRLAA